MHSGIITYTGLLNLIFVSTSLVLAAETPDPKFFANSAFLERFPGATVLHEKSREFVEQSLQTTYTEANALIQAIQRDKDLAQDILEFPKLTAEDKINVMKDVFDLQVLNSHLSAPELVLDSMAKKSTFFDFNIENPGPGKVVLNPAKLFADTNPYAALLFLVHETRHSYQFQIGFVDSSQGPHIFGANYIAGFSAQKQIFDHGLPASFCDFLTLNQEYEAFLFGNYVMEKLTQGEVDTSGMGTWASQYILNQGLRLDLPRLIQETDPSSLLDRFNMLEKAQYQELHRQ